MHTHDYNPYHDAHTRELMDSLSNDDVLALHSALRTLGYVQWTAWLFAHSSAIGLFLSGNAAARKRQLRACADDNERLMLQYGSIWAAQLAARVAFETQALAEKTEKSDSRLRRAARGEVCLQACHVLFEQMNEWPFDEPPLDSPFDEPIGEDE